MYPSFSGDALIIISELALKLEEIEDAFVYSGGVSVIPLKVEDREILP